MTLHLTAFTIRVVSKYVKCSSLAVINTVYFIIMKGRVILSYYGVILTGYALEQPMSESTLNVQRTAHIKWAQKEIPNISYLHYILIFL